MLEGEKQALLQQVTLHIEATKKKLRGLGLKHVEVGLFDERTRFPIGHHDQLIAMAEGKCVCGADEKKPLDQHGEECMLNILKAPKGGAPVVGTEGAGE